MKLYIIIIVTFRMFSLYAATEYRDTVTDTAERPISPKSGLHLQKL